MKKSGHSKTTYSAGKALIIDQCSTYSLPLIRALARKGYNVEVFAEPQSPALLSHFCGKALAAPSFRDAKMFSATIQSVVQSGNYDVIYLCSEDVLPQIMELAKTSDCWRALPLSDPADLRILLSKRAVLTRVAEAGVPVPLTISITNALEVPAASAQVGFPLLIKGDTGEGSHQVKMVHDPSTLNTEYSLVAALAAGGSILPCVQEYVRGPKYTVAGLFDRGRPLRIMSYLSELTYPPVVGATIKGVTQAPLGLLDEASKAFSALRFTGLGNAEFIKDVRDGSFKFLEINPRVWANFGFAEHAGVDLIAPYRQLADGNIVEPDLAFKTEIHYRRWLNDLRLTVKQPERLFGFLVDSFKPTVFSDFSWNDLGATFPIHYFIARLSRSTRQKYPVKPPKTA